MRKAPSEDAAPVRLRITALTARSRDAEVCSRSDFVCAGFPDVGVLQAPFFSRLASGRGELNCDVPGLGSASPAALPTDLINTALTTFDGITLDCYGSIVVSAWRA